MRNVSACELPAICSELNSYAPDWVEVLPPGPAISGRDGRSWTYDPQEVIASTVARGVDLPFDYLHATELKAPNGEESPAAGWAREYRVNSRGAVEARVDWTSRARSHIASREYRYVSPVFLYDDSGRIHRFSSFGLVNKPNLALRALNAESAHAPSMHNLDSAQEAVARMLGMSPGEYISHISHELNSQTQPDGLSPVQEQVARMLGMSAGEYLSHVSHDPITPAHRQGLNSVQEEAARMLGMTSTEYLSYLSSAG